MRLVNLTLDLFTGELATGASPLGTKEPAAGSLHHGSEIRAIITQAVKESPFDRHEIAARMSRALGQTISKSTLDSWTADSKHQHRFPFEFVDAFEQATGSYALTNWLAEKRGGQFVVGREVLLAELGRIAGMENDLRRYKTRIKQELRSGRPQ